MSRSRRISNTINFMTKTLFTTAAISATLVGAAVAGNVDALDASFGGEKNSFLDRFTFGSYGEIHTSFKKDGGTDTKGGEFFDAHNCSPRD